MLFICVRLSTQMFSVFIKEQLTSPEQNEIRFFSEAIIDKKNRSKKIIIKSETPFLNNKRFFNYFKLISVMFCSVTCASCVFIVQ